MSFQNSGNLKLGSYQEVLADEVDEFLELAKTVKQDLSIIQSEQYPRSTALRDWSSVVPPIWDADLLETYIRNIVNSQFHSEIQPSDSSSHKAERTAEHTIKLLRDIEPKDEELVCWKLVANSKDTQTEDDILLDTAREFQKSKSCELHKVRSGSSNELKTKFTNSSPATKQTKSTSPKKYNCLRFVGSLPPQKIDFNADHPKLVLKEPKSEVLFPRRCSKPQKTLKLSIKEPTMVQKEHRKHRVDNTWHEELISAKNTIKSPKVLRYTAKSTSPVCKKDQIPISPKADISGQTKENKGKDIIYDPTTIESTVFVPDLLKHKIQNLPILCIRGECKVQRTVNISVADKVEADGKLNENDKNNVRYYTYVHNSSNPNFCEIEDIGGTKKDSSEFIPELPSSRKVNRFIAPFHQRTCVTEEECPDTEKGYESSGENSSAKSTNQNSETSSRTDEEKLRMKRQKGQKKNPNKPSFVVQSSLSDSSLLVDNGNSSSDNLILNILREVFLQSDNGELSETETLHLPNLNLISVTPDCNRLPDCKNVSVQTYIEKNSVPETECFQHQKSITHDILNKILKDKPKCHTKLNSHWSTANTFKPMQLSDHRQEKIGLKHMPYSSTLSNHIIVTNSTSTRSASSPSIENIESSFETNQNYSGQNELKYLKRNETKKSCSSLPYKCDQRWTATRNKLEDFPDFNVEGRNAKCKSEESLLCRTPSKILNKSLTERDFAVRRASRSFLQSLQDSEFEKRSCHHFSGEDDYVWEIGDGASAFDAKSINRNEPDLEGSTSSIPLTNFDNFLKYKNAAKNDQAENLTDDEFLKIGCNKSQVKFLNVSKEITASPNSIEFHISKLKVLDNGVDVKSSLSSSSSDSSVKILRSVNVESTTDGEVLSLGEVKTFSDESGF